MRKISLNWDEMSLDALYTHYQSNGPTPDMVIEAIMYSVRTRGLEALNEPATIERLKRCDEAARAQIDARIAKLFPTVVAA